MPRPKTPWFSRFKGKRSGAAPGSERPDMENVAYGATDLLTNNTAYEYLLGSVRTNAPGFDSNSNPIEQSRQFVGTTYLAVKSFAEQAGQAEIKLYEHDPDNQDDREQLSHWEDAAQLLHHPNPDDTFGEILEQAAIQNKLTGTAALWLPHDPEDPHDVPREMYVLSTASLLPQPISPRYPNGSYLVQPWYPAGPYGVAPAQRGIGAIVPAEQIIRIKEPHPFFRWTGYATLYAIGTQMDSMRMIDLTRMNHMSRGFDPAAVLMFDPSIKRPSDADLRRLEAQLQNVWQGPQNAGRIIAAPFGIDKIETFGTTPKDMVYEQGWQQLRDFALASFRTNAGVAGLTDGLTYATLYASLRWFYVFGLAPFLNKVAQHLTRHVLQPFFHPSFLLELVGKSITDEELVEKQTNTLARFGAIKKGELRRMYNKLGYPITLEETDEDDEWIGADKQQGAGGEQGAGGAEGQGGEENPLAALMGGQQKPGDSTQEQQGPDDNAMQRKRPVNEQGRGSKGPQGPDARKSLTFADRADRLGAAIEKHLTNGRIKPHKR